MKYMRIIIIILLVFNALSALLGGGALLWKPDGGFMQMPVEMLEHSPFTDFLIPGLILFSVLGLGSAVTALLYVLNKTSAPRAGMAEGTATMIWIIVQVMMIRGFHPLHAIYGITGLLIFTLSSVYTSMTRKTMMN